MTARPGGARWYHLDSALHRDVGLLRSGLDWPTSRELGEQIATPGSVAGAWPDFTWQLVNGEFAHWQPSSAPGCAVSETLRRVIDDHARPGTIEWLPVTVVSDDLGEERRYWILSLLEQADHLVPRPGEDGRLVRLAREFDPQSAGPWSFVAAWRGDYQLRSHASHDFRSAVEDARCGLGIKWIAGEPTPEIRPSERDPATELPADVLADLARGGVLTERSGPNGRLELRSVSELRTEWVPVEHVDSDDSTEVEVITLSDTSCWDFVVWVPALQRFGSYDVDHSAITFFPNATWADLRERFEVYSQVIWNHTDDVPHLQLDPDLDL